MTYRTRLAELEALTARLNAALDRPTASWHSENGRNIAHVGHIHLDGAYGGWRVVEMVNEGGGIRTLTEGFQSKPIVADLLRALLRGAELARPK